MRPFDIPIKGDYLYFIIFTDDFSQYGYTFLVRHKSEAFKRSKKFRCEVEKHTKKSLKALQSDQGGKYLSKNFFGYLKKNGIVSQ